MTPSHGAGRAGANRRAPVPLPAGFALRFDPDTRRPRPGVLIGGAPLRVLRLSERGAALVDAWMAGRPVGGGRGGGRLAARLVEAGMVHPVPPPDSPIPTCQVVIPVRDDPTGLSVTLEALAATAPGIGVCVVDDGSVPPLVPPSGATLVGHRTSAGPAAARNTGWRAVERGARSGADSSAPIAGPQAPEVVVFVDAGCIPAPGWLADLLVHFADPAVAAVAPRIISRAEPGTPAVLAGYEARRSPLDMGRRAGPVRPGGRVPYVPTAALAVRRSALVEMGGFDETLRFGEDVDLVWRLQEAGHRIRYEPSAEVSHPARPSYGAWLKQRFSYGRSAAPLASRHGRAVAPLAVQPWSVGLWALAVTGHPVLGALVGAGTAQALARRAAGDRVVASELRRLALTGNLAAGGALVTAIRRAWLPPALVAGDLAWRRGGRRTRTALLLGAAAVVAGPAFTAGPVEPGGGPGGGSPGRRTGPAGGGGTPHRGNSDRDPAAVAARGAAPVALALLGLVDDLAYQAGVWDGAVRARSAGALLPRW